MHYVDLSLELLIDPRSSGTDIYFSSRGCFRGRQDHMRPHSLLRQVGLLMTYISKIWAALAILAWNLVSWFPERLLLKYAQSLDNALRCEDSSFNLSCKPNMVSTTVMKAVQRDCFEPCRVPKSCPTGDQSTSTSSKSWQIYFRSVKHTLCYHQSTHWWFLQ